MSAASLDLDTPFAKVRARAIGLALGIITMCACVCLHSARADNVDGAWSPVFDWPLISIHAALTPDGRVLTYGTDGAGKQTGFFIYDIWDPVAAPASGHMTLDNMTLTDIFCSSQIILPQSGDILIAGGDNWTGTGTTNTGNNNSNLFDYGDNTLARSANMNRSRWYSSSTALVNGEIYIQGGSGGADRPEVREVDGDFRLLSNAPTGGYATLFPRNFLAPDGRVFGYDTSGKMYFVATAGTGSISAAGQFASANAGWTSGAAMFRPGRILQMGGNSNGAVVIDINGPQPTVTTAQSMSSQRQWVSATVLADGQVLATGGSEVDNQLTGVNNSAEIWNPDTSQWHVGASAVPARLYHSSALLLPDATVLVAGGGAPGPQVNTNAEIYSPPYLFDGNGDLATRPQIQSAPDTANVGDSLAIQVDSVISRVTLVKTGSVTHSVNMDQRFLELPFTTSGNMLQVNLPVRASDTPPGFYMMFAISDSGVPSVGKILRINIDPTPNTAVDYTPTIGGGGGNPFQLACNSDEILVGVYGNYATYVNQIGPQCVKMDQLGRWIGDPVNRPVTGTTTTGTDFDKTCPRDFAVSGFQGRAGQYVDQLDIQCKALTPAGGLTGPVQFLGADGGSGGTAQGPHSCGTDNPVYALYGRSGGRIDSVGVQCRPGVITPISINSEPVIVNPGTQSDTVGLPAGLQISASDGDGDVLTYSAAGLPPGLQMDTATGQISGTPTTDGTFSTQVTVSDGTDADSANFDWNIALALPLTVDPMPPQTPREVNTVINYTATAHDGVNVIFKWDFGDGTPETAYSSSPTQAHTYTEPGIYYITLTVNDDFGIPDIQTFVQTIYLPLTAGKPGSSTKITYEERTAANSRLWVVNQDNNSVSVFDAVTNTKLAEVPVGLAPRSVAIASDGRVWVSNKSAASISIIDPITLAVDQTITMPFASQPYGIVFAAAANEAFVVLEATGRVVKLDALSGAQLGSIDVGPHPRHIAINSDQTSLYVSRFVTPRQPGEETAAPQSEVGGVKFGGEVLVVDTATMAVTDTIVLQHSDMPDAENQGSGVPNYLGPVALSPDGVTAWVPSKQDNIGRGTLRSGANINFQNSVRAISSRIDIAGAAENYSGRIDHDNSSVASAAVIDSLGIYMFVALETSREVAVVDIHGGAELFRIDTGRAPQGLALSSDGETLFVSNFMDRSVTIIDISVLQTTGDWVANEVAILQSVGNEVLSAEVLNGKQLFYDARDTRLARDRYLSCASCHNDGSGDGRVWDLSGMGEGLRNTITLQGTAADDGRLHWSQNFDEVQDFEGQIRGLSEGTGLMTNLDFNAGTRSDPLGDPKAGVSADLDALAAYVSSLGEYANSPHRNSDGTLTAEGELGRDVFRREDCAACHSGVEFTDSDTNILHDIGTIKASSGLRLGGPLVGIDTPTLRGAWSSAPYLHDGSAASLSEAVAAHDTVALDAGEMTSLVAYLLQIDVNEASAPLPNVPPTITNPGDQAHETGDSVTLGIDASDSDGGTLSYSASGLPDGLSISVISGLISGTPTTAGAYAVDVTVDDGEDSASTSFTWDITVPNVPPTITNPGDQAHETGDSVTLAIEANDSDGGTLNFVASGLPAGLTINSTSGVINGTPTTADTNVVTVTVDDGEDSASTSFNWDITVPNVPPTITNPGDQAHETGDSVTLSIDASDSDGGTLSFSATGLPDGLSISVISGLISGSPTAAGSFAVTVTVDDGEDSASASFNWDITVPNVPPTITNPGDQAHETGDNITLAIQANDSDGGTLTFAATGLPAGLAINVSTGVISGSATTAVSYAVTVTVDDGEDSASTSFSWDITVPNVPPTITNPGDQAHETGDTVTLAIEANDSDGGTLNFLASGLPAGLIINSTTGVISGTPTTAGSYGVTVTVDDGEDSASTSFSWDITVPNVPPTITNPGDQAHETGDSVTLPIQANDSDGGTLSYAATGLPAGLSISSTTGVISGTPTTASSYAVTVTVDDGEDSASTSFSWDITVPNVPPTITNPGDQAHETGDTVTLAIEANDSDGGTLNFLASGLPAGLIINSTTGVISGTPTTAGSYAVTVTVDDGEDSASTSFSWDITVPNVPPTITNPGDQAHETGDSVTLPIQANDSDGGTLSYAATGLPAGLSISSTTGVISGSPTVASSYAVTVTVDDGEDSASTSFSWDVTVPNVPPTITNPGDQAHETGDTVTLAIEANDSDGGTLNFLASGLPAGLIINSTTGVISGSPTTASSYAVTVTVDDGEDSASTSFSWDITVPNVPPTITNPGDQAHETGDNITLAIQANDSDGGTLTFAATGLPAGLAINVSTGVISGSATTAGSYAVTVTVDDGEDSASTSFSWDITVPNVRPTITNPGDQAHETGDSVTLAIQANDADGGTLTYSESGLPAGLAINTSTGVINGTPTTAGSFTVTVIVDDGEDSASTSFSWDITVPNVPPTITNPGDQADETGDSVTLAIQASDSDGGTLSYAASGLPDGLSISVISGVIGGTPTTAGSYAVTVTADDGEDSASTSFSWDITVPNVPPTITNPGDQAHETGDSVTLAIQASDPDGGTLSYAASGLPDGLSISVISGVISGTPTTAGSYSVTVTVDDGEDSASTSFSWDITVPNVPPTITNPGDQAHETGDSVTLPIQANDADGGTLTFAATGLPAGLSINTSTGVISGTPTTAGSFAVTVTVDDGEDSASTSFSWDITVPNVPPTITNLGDQAHETGDSVTLAIQASDSDGGTLSYAASGLPDGLSISVISGVISGTPTTAGSYSVTVTVDDGEDSASTSFSWDITVPNVPPTITNPGDQAHETGDSVSLPIQANDADGGTLSFSASGLPNGLSISAISGVISGTPTTAGAFAVTVTVDDGEDSASTSFNWDITVPNVPPTITNSGDQAHETGDSVTLAIQASDPDGGTLSYAASGLPGGLSISVISGVISGTPTTAGSYSVTVTVDDGEDSASTSFSWDITVPNVPPTITNPGDQAHETGDSVTLPIQANDADGGTLTFAATGLPAGLSINTSTGVISGTPTTAGSFAVTVTVDDGEDSASTSFSWDITVPNVPPTITNLGDQAHETGDSVTLAIQASDSDGGTLSYAASGLPDGLSISVISGVISGTPNTAGSHAVTVTVDDGEDSASTSFSWDITVPNVPPTITNPGDQAHETGDSISLPIQANDSDGGTLIFSASGLPTGLTINTATGVLSGTPIAVGDHSVTVMVDDGQDSASASFGWTIAAPILPPEDSVPTVTNPGARADETGSNVFLAIQAYDADGDSLSYIATGLPSGLAIDAVTGEITGRPTKVGTSIVTVTVDDGVNSVSVSFDWDIVSFGWDNAAPNAPPNVSNPGPQVDEMGYRVNLPIEASDDDGGILSYAVSGLPEGLVIDPVTGNISGTPTTTGSNTVTVTVDDGAASSSISFAWAIMEPGALNNQERNSGGGAISLFWLFGLALFSGYRALVTGSRR